ncbi:hypothetical protein AR457_33265 [Streptomyces agglomeratus]|uniref:Uncharacterized protein n=1 Tax=Streptomyces agglomeratus TaxID=285458 RepID=A0A1E5PGT8_9ACTN|nr:hypothetical protein [Streptomyces agglomeratus]OEJ28604.1 hypothetical protein AS594_33155 [Streptomyces agglomeratus]OEJ37332.1 hypothetical protein BGK70_03405 [Streptomyces agglomeratus]OEJ48287.1 hypothetical protein AR457_33265 [Streptomyces agglomeratus]OEJ49875.1 hypothetical protein BGK72_02910 [Streptomyces agglomeratus]
MTNHDATRARLRLDGALGTLADTFRGMTARSDENQCACHWGSAEELARLKVPDLELDPDLLRRTWQAGDWDDHGAVLRRILPQFARALVSGLVEPFSGMDEVGHSFACGRWQQWPPQQSAAVWEFLRAWWARTLTETRPSVPVHEVLALCAEASATLTPWLATWEALAHPMADRHLAEAVAHWEYDLLMDEHPWEVWRGNEEELCSELAAWLARHASARLRARNAPEEFLHRVRLIGLTGTDRWEDPHWPNYP